MGEETGKKGIALTPYFAKAWNGLDETKKEKFNKASQKEMVGYRKKMAVYKKTASYKEFQQKKKMKKLRSKKPKDTNAPKRPSSGYFLFLKEVRPAVVKQNPEGGIAVIGKAIGKMWRELDDAKKAKYVKKAAIACEKWQKKVAAYKKTQKYADYLTTVAEHKAEMKSKVKAMKAKTAEKKKKIVRRKK